LYQVHWAAEDGTAVEECWQAFQLRTAESIGIVDAIQPQFNLIHLAGHPDFTGRALSANLALAAALRPVAERHEVTTAAVAIAWMLAFPEVTGAIAGARRPGQADGWLPAATLAPMAAADASAGRPVPANRY
jgi:hypothetical protein